MNILFIRFTVDLNIDPGGSTCGTPRGGMGAVRHHDAAATSTTSWSSPASYISSMMSEPPTNSPST